MSTRYARTINSDPIYAAICDADAAGNNIQNTYATKSELPTVPSAGNMLSVTNSTLNVTTTAGITDIQVVSALPASPVATVLYIIPET